MKWLVKDILCPLLLHSLSCSLRKNQEDKNVKTNALALKRVDLQLMFFSLIEKSNGLKKCLYEPIKPIFTNFLNIKLKKVSFQFLINILFPQRENQVWTNGQV